MKRSIAFLASKMPEETKNYAPLSAPTRKPSINPVQAAQFLRYKEAIENPQGALERFGRGEVRREDVETLRVVAPKAFETIQVRVLQRLTDAQAKGVVIPHEQRLKLSLLLDIKGDATLEPGMLRVLHRTSPRHQKAAEMDHSKAAQKAARSSSREPSLPERTSLRPRERQGRNPSGPKGARD